MLVVSRKTGRGIVIGDQIRITVVAVHGRAVRLGIEAASETPVRREEHGTAGKTAAA